MSNIPPGEVTQDPVAKPELKVKGLPAGWRREVVVRKNGQSAGKTDVYYYSPCGKKFRSKPQIARFLGESADLTVFDFSRAGTPGDGSSRRRARDRTARRAVDVAKSIPPLVRPLTNNPLRPSGPTRRTCGVIKLPVTWVSPPSDEEVKQSAIKLPINPPPEVNSESLTGSGTPAAAPVAAPESELKPVEEQPKPLPPPPPPPPPAVDQLRPTFWMNRLQGVNVYDHETGSEIKVNQEKLKNALDHSTLINGNVTLPKALSGLEAKLAVPGVINPTLGSLLGATTTGADISKKPHLPVMPTGNIVPSLLIHGKKSVASLSATSSIMTSLKNVKENGSLVSLSKQKNLASNIILTFPSVASVNAFKANQGAVIAPVAVASSQGQIQNARVGSGVVSVPNPGAVAPAIYVSESDLQLQQEKVNLLRKQLMAAQSTV